MKLRLAIFAIACGVLLLTGLLALRWLLTHPDVPAYDPNDVERVVYQDQWRDWERQIFYTAPQGTRIVGLPAKGDRASPVPYSWIVHLERPFSRERFADPEYLARFGFLINHEASGPRALPVGFAKHEDPDWWGPGKKEDVLDLGCAACHTGELYYRTPSCGTGPPPRGASRDAKLCGLRIDGGQAMHSIASSSLHLPSRSFAQEMAVSMLFTYVDPFKWRRFRAKVLADDGEEHADELAGRFRKVLGELRRKAWQECGISMLLGVCEHYPTEEGPGRTDALGRIANTLFGRLRLDYYRVADAPVNYPHLWDIWIFDRVQWGHSARQPMGRNVGEALGVGASWLTSEQDPFESSAELTDLYCTEVMLRNLEPPSWPEDILPPVDPDEAQAGRELFSENCRSCHGVHPNPHPPNDKPIEWRVSSPRIDRVGTDPRAARNFLCRRYDVNQTSIASYIDSLPAVGAPPRNLGDLCEPVLDGQPGCESDDWAVRCATAGKTLEVITRNVQEQGYDRLHLTPAERHEFDGFGLDTHVEEDPVYKARPLEGVWATPPFLHNGSVRTIYQLLSPPYEREDQFWVGSREYDPVHLGYESIEEPGAFLFDTREPGNSNAGHLFVGDPSVTGKLKGVIGPALSHRERMQIIEYLKVLRDRSPADRQVRWAVPEPCRKLWTERCSKDRADNPYCEAASSEWYDPSIAQR